MNRCTDCGTHYDAEIFSERCPHAFRWSETREGELLSRVGPEPQPNPEPNCVTGGEPR